MSDLIENLPEEEDEILIQRQALHAFRLCFNHPVTGKRLEFEAPIPDDIQKALTAIRTHRAKPTPKRK